MPWRNSSTHYGWIGIAFHWIVTLGVVGLFALGLWMTGLSYYHPWYYEAVDWHQSLGLLLLVVVILRLAWRWANPTPAFEPEMAPWEHVAARAAHWLMYCLMLVILLSGYFILTAEGEPVPVFDWFQVPAFSFGIERQADIAGWLHYWLAWALIVVAGLHTLAALKHHFVDRDRTLKRILRSEKSDT